MPQNLVLAVKIIYRFELHSAKAKKKLKILKIKCF